MATYDKAHKSLAEWAGVPGVTKGALYQFPKGHWGWCTENSPIFKNLQDGFIYKDLGIKPISWQVIKL